MATQTYTVRAYDRDDLYVTEGSVSKWKRFIVFTIVEEGYSGTVALDVEGFTRQKAKAAVDAAIDEYFAKKPKIYEWSKEVIV